MIDVQVIKHDSYKKLREINELSWRYAKIPPHIIYEIDYQLHPATTLIMRLSIIENIKEKK